MIVDCEAVVLLAVSKLGERTIALLKETVE